MITDINPQVEKDLLSPTEAANLMGMSLHLFKYHLKKPDAPRPILVGRFLHPFFREGDLLAWNPQNKQQEE